MKVGDLVKVYPLTALARANWEDESQQVGVIIRMWDYWASPDEYVLEIKASSGEIINAHSSCVEVISASRG